jgi:hypothetical protein
MEEQTLLTSPWRSQRGALPQLVHPVVFTLMQHSAVDGHATLGCVTIARHGDITIRPYGVSNPKPSGPMASMIGSRLLSVTGSTHGFCPSSLPTSNARKVATESLCSGIREPQFRSSEHASSANIGTAEVAKIEKCPFFARWICAHPEKNRNASAPSDSAVQVVGRACSSTKRKGDAGRALRSRSASQGSAPPVVRAVAAVPDDLRVDGFLLSCRKMPLS